MTRPSTTCSAYMTFPKAHPVKLHSITPMERINGEIERGTDVVGIFPNDEAHRW